MKKNKTDDKIPIYKLKSKEKVLEYYDEWTKKEKYNKDMIEWNYQAPENTAQLLDKFSNNKDIKILDAGCGTGLVGENLKSLGYKHLFGVDFSQQMLDLVKPDLYQKLELIDLNKKLYYANSIFDAVICAGTFTYGHVKNHALDEFIRITKTNGYICFTINEGIYKEYEFDKKIDQLENKKLWEICDFSKSTYIVNKDISAWLCLARKI